MRVLTLALLGLLAAQPLSANDLDAVFWTMEDRLGDRFMGETYAHNNEEKRRSLRWICTSCDHKQSIHIGLYDFEENYLTTDTDKVMRMVTGGCGYGACVTRPYDRSGLNGLVQTGIKRGQIAKRTVLFIGPRMLLIEVRGVPAIAASDKLHMAVETAVLSELETAR